MGHSSVQAIVANKLFPGLLDRYLATAGYRGQLGDETVDLSQLDNLFDPAPGDADTHGRFDGRASTLCPQLWATKHRNAVLTTGLAIAGFLATLLVGARSLARQE